MEGLKVDDATPDKAWVALRKADQEKEVEDIRKVSPVSDECNGYAYVLTIE